MWSHQLLLVVSDTVGNKEIQQRQRAKQGWTWGTRDFDLRLRLRVVRGHWWDCWSNGRLRLIDFGWPTQQQTVFRGHPTENGTGRHFYYQYSDDFPASRGPRHADCCYSGAC